MAPERLSRKGVHVLLPASMATAAKQLLSSSRMSWFAKCLQVPNTSLNCACRIPQRASAAILFGRRVTSVLEKLVKICTSARLSYKTVYNVMLFSTSSATESPSQLRPRDCQVFLELGQVAWSSQAEGFPLVGEARSSHSSRFLTCFAKFLT